VLTVAAFLAFLFVSLRRERQQERTTDDRRLDAEIANRI
jgi:hypothetical protein